MALKNIESINQNSGLLCDGNDVFWLDFATGKTSTDFSSATKLRYGQALSLKDRYILLPFDIADAHKRPWCYL